ncbi:HNH/ENDO VII family nuclease [Nocardia sp. NPDC003963]
MVDDILAMAWREAAGRLEVSLGERTPYVLARLYHRSGADLEWMVRSVEHMDPRLTAKVMQAAQRAVERGMPLPEIRLQLGAVQNRHRAGLASGQRSPRIRLEQTRQALADLNAPPATSRDAAPEEPKTYSRPSGYRKGMREKVFERNSDGDGVVRDPLTGRAIEFDDPWHMGHRPGMEFWKHQRDAAVRGITREEFLDEHYDWRRYRPELAASNLSHAGEDRTDHFVRLPDDESQ